MSQPNGAPEHVVAPNQYQYEAFAALLQHHEFVGATIPEHELSWALPAMVNMGRVALANEDFAEYQNWERHLSSFVDALQPRTDMTFTREQFYSHVAELRFFGAAAGDTRSSDLLHGMLYEDGTDALDAVLRLCAEHDVAPDAWINQHTATAEERNRAWITYLTSRRFHASEQGRDLTVAEQRSAGAM